MPKNDLPDFEALRRKAETLFPARLDIELTVPVCRLLETVNGTQLIHTENIIWKSLTNEIRLVREEEITVIDTGERARRQWDKQFDQQADKHWIGSCTVLDPEWDMAQVYRFQGPEVYGMVDFCDIYRGYLKAFCWMNIVDLRLNARSFKDIARLADTDPAALFSIAPRYAFPKESDSLGWVCLEWNSSRSSRICWTPDAWKYIRSDVMNEADVCRLFNLVKQAHFAADSALAEFAERWTGRDSSKDPGQLITKLFETAAARYDGMYEDRLPKRKKELLAEMRSKDLNKDEKAELYAYAATQVNSREMREEGSVFAWPVLSGKKNLMLVYFQTDGLDGSGSVMLRETQRTIAAPDAHIQLRGNRYISWKEKCLYEGPRVSREVFCRVLARSSLRGIPFDRLNFCEAALQYNPGRTLSENLNSRDLETAFQRYTDSAAFRMLMDKEMSVAAWRWMKRRRNADAESLEELFGLDPFPQWLIRLNPRCEMIEALKALKRDMPDVFEQADPEDTAAWLETFLRDGGYSYKIIKWMLQKGGMSLHGLGKSLREYRIRHNAWPFSGELVWRADLLTKRPELKDYFPVLSEPFLSPLPDWPWSVDPSTLWDFVQQPDEDLIELENGWHLRQAHSCPELEALVRLCDAQHKMSAPFAAAGRYSIYFFVKDGDTVPTDMLILHPDGRWETSAAGSFDTAQYDYMLALRNAKEDREEERRRMILYKSLQ